MKNTLHSLTLSLVLLINGNTFGQTTTKFNDGYLTVFKVTSSSALTSTGTAIVVEEYDPATANQSAANYSVTLPASTGNKLVVSGTATSLGGMTRSENGRYLILPGYDGLVGDANSTFTTNATLRTLNGTGTVGAGISGSGTTLWLSGSNNLRAGTSDDGTNYWITGSAVGIQTSTNGTTMTTVSTTSTNNRDVFIYNGQLYLTTGAGTKGIYSVGTGKPTTTGQTSTLLFTPTNTDPYAFSLSPDGTTIYYIASITGGIYRSTYNGSSWTGGTQIFSASSYTGLAVDWTNYTFSTSSANGARIYACNPSTLIAANDNGTSTLTTTVLRTEPITANNAFRQLAFSPIKQTVSLGSNTPALGNINTSASNVVLFQFNLNADEGNSTIKKIIVNQTGTASIGAGNDINNFRLIEDVNNNGIAEPSELSASLATGAVSGSDIAFSSINLSSYINEGTSKNFIMVGDVSSSATAGNTFIPNIVSNKTLNSISYTTNITNAGGSWINAGTTAPTGNTLTIYIPTTPIIILNTGNFNGTFGNVTIGSSSASSSFTVSGSNLTANLIVTPPSGFEIRTGTNSFSTAAMTLIPASGSVANTAIDVRFTPTSAISFTGTISCTSTGATEQDAAVNGTGVQATQLVITNINPTNPFQNIAFSVTVQSEDGSNIAQNVLNNTNVSLALTSGSGILSGNLTGTINAGNNSVIITGILYNTAETGVVLTASRTSGDVLTSGNSPAFNVVGVATKLAFVSVPTSGIAGTNLASFTVEARKDDNTVDNNFTGDITISKASGPGILSGTTTITAVAGTATFNTLQFDQTGTVTLLATAAGFSDTTSGNILILDTPSLSEVLLPQYMEGNSSSNTTRLPFTFRVTLNNLHPNATYRYYNQVVIATDLSNSTGAGNCIFAIPGGFVRTTSPGLSTTGSYHSFTTDAFGSYTGWFIIEPTGNSRFTPGNNVFMRILLNDGAGGTTIVTRLTTTSPVQVLNLATDASNGTGLTGTSSAIPENFVFTYDNVNGTGRPISGTYVESDGVPNTTGNSYPAFYANNVEGVPGAYGTIIPNTNPNGILRVEQRDFTTGNMVACPATDADGIWQSGANTVNPAGGTTAIVLTSADVPLDPNTTVAGIISGDTTVCSGTNSGTLTLSGYTGSILKWQYSIDNFVSDIQDISNTATSQTYLNLLQTTYYRAVIQSGSCSVVNTTPAVITVNPASVGGTISTNIAVCSGANSGTLTLAGYTGNILKWQYSTDNFVSDIHDTSNTSTSQMYFNLTQTTYYRAVIQNGLCSAANSTIAAITVTPIPIVSLIPFISPVCVDVPAFSLTGGSPAGGAYSGVGVSAGIFNPMTSGTGTFAITYTVTVNSCSNADMQNIAVSLCTGISENDVQRIHLYPNPGSGIFNIAIKNANISKLLITVVDIQGNEVYKELDKQIATAYNKQINLEKLAKGIYCIQLNNGTEVKIQKLIIQ